MRLTREAMEYVTGETVGRARTENAKKFWKKCVVPLSMRSMKR